jgi:hypothetical protein
MKKKLKSGWVINFIKRKQSKQIEKWTTLNIFINSLILHHSIANGLLLKDFRCRRFNQEKRHKIAMKKYVPQTVVHIAGRREPQIFHYK